MWIDEKIALNNAMHVFLKSYVPWVVLITKGGFFSYTACGYWNVFPLFAVQNNFCIVKNKMKTLSALPTLHGKWIFSLFHTRKVIIGKFTIFPFPGFETQKVFTFFVSNPRRCSLSVFWSEAKFVTPTQRLILYILKVANNFRTILFPCCGPPHATGTKVYCFLDPSCLLNIHVFTV